MEKDFHRDGRLISTYAGNCDNYFCEFQIVFPLRERHLAATSKNFLWHS